NGLPDGFTPELVQVLFDRQLAQSDVALLQLFTGAPIEPAEMIRAMRIHGFLLSDPVGNHVPPEAFRIDPTVNMSEDYVIWVDRFLEHVTVSPEVIGEELFRQAMRQRVLIQARPGLQRFRLSADKRGALENGLHPRQILTLLSPEAPQLTGEAYARRWQLPLAAAEAELTALVEAGFLEARRWELETVAPPQFVPAEGVTSRIFIRLLFIVMALLWLQRILPDRRWPALGILLWTGFAATEISQTATTLPSAAATGLWLTLPVLLVLILTLKTIRPDLAAAAAAPAETDPHSAPHSPSATPPAP
ncbi:hypothetical protein, partial [Limnospira sp. Paracas R14]|uniref:hypothetical protein n=1 Tax=Limnospira sp. Paracas R14 TaxID=2981108 RepID=UPI0028E14275|nr:hypothetical protein [Limnospira sp. Paracas R14]